jgi:hypothetical protein
MCNVGVLNFFFADCCLYRKKDGVNIDNFVEYEKLVKKILDEEPSKMIVYLDLDDVKASAKVHSIFYIYDAYSGLKISSDVIMRIRRVMKVLVRGIVM